ncbi:hypothetical protein F2P81_014362 [Scophthalmus maximus]|uniref:Uncharacterized protein n=1 Tax=Scophthalmus maximus TaxID=52904 RepID=A0A6A4SGL8_SCOMX|nr:hypothetical protein F2P81_014362 [Scophthalmus maximus]
MGGGGGLSGSKTRSRQKLKQLQSSPVDLDVIALCSLHNVICCGGLRSKRQKEEKKKTTTTKKKKKKEKKETTKKREKDKKQREINETHHMAFVLGASAKSRQRQKSSVVTSLIVATLLGTPVQSTAIQYDSFQRVYNVQDVSSDAVRNV